MAKEVPYYTLDEEGNSEYVSSKGEAYIDDDDLKDLLIELLGTISPMRPFRKYLMPHQMRI